jgi:hypothetical protein
MILDGGEWSVSPTVPDVWEAGQAADPVWTLWIREKNLLSLLGIEPKTRKTSGLVTILAVTTEDPLFIFHCFRTDCWTSPPPPTHFLMGKVAGAFTRPLFFPFNTAV